MLIKINHFCTRKVPRVLLLGCKRRELAEIPHHLRLSPHNILPSDRSAPVSGDHCSQSRQNIAHHRHKVSASAWERAEKTGKL